MCKLRSCNKVNISENIRSVTYLVRMKDNDEGKIGKKNTKNELGAST